MFLTMFIGLSTGYLKKLRADFNEISYEDRSKSQERIVMTSYPEFGFPALMGNLFILEIFAYNHSVPRCHPDMEMAEVCYLRLLLLIIKWSNLTFIIHI